MNSVKSAFEMQVRACRPARRAYVAYCLAFLNLGACRYHRVGKMTVERLLAVIVAYTYEVTVAAPAAAGALPQLCIQELLLEVTVPSATAITLAPKIPPPEISIPLWV